MTAEQYVNLLNLFPAYIIIFASSFFILAYGSFFLKWLLSNKTSPVFYDYEIIIPCSIILSGLIVLFFYKKVLSDVKHIPQKTIAVKDGKIAFVFEKETYVWADDPRIADAHLEQYHVSKKEDVQFRFSGQHSVIYTGKFQIDYSYGGTLESYMAYANFIKNNTDITGLVNQFIIDGQATIKNPGDQAEIESVKENLKKFLIAQLGDVKVNFTKISFSVMHVRPDG